MCLYICFILHCIIVLYYYYITVQYYVRHLEYIWICATQLAF